jgi:hypothetical protein
MVASLPGGSRRDDGTVVLSLALSDQPSANDLGQLVHQVHLTDVACRQRREAGLNVRPERGRDLQSRHGLELVGSSGSAAGADGDELSRGSHTRPAGEETLESSVHGVELPPPQTAAELHQFDTVADPVDAAEDCVVVASVEDEPSVFGLAGK